MADEKKKVGHIEKATFPTTKQEIACDYFDKILTTGLHKTEESKEVKLNVVLDGEVSLYREDVEMLIHHLEDLLPFVACRLPEVRELQNEWRTLQ